MMKWPSDDYKLHICTNDNVPFLLKLLPESHKQKQYVCIMQLSNMYVFRLYVAMWHI